MLTEKELDNLNNEFEKIVSNFIINNKIEMAGALSLLATQLLKGFLISRLSLESIKKFLEEILLKYHDMSQEKNR